MNIPYQIPGLFLTVLCHVIVIYHMLEHRYTKKGLSSIAVCI